MIRPILSGLLLAFVGCGDGSVSVRVVPSLPAGDTAAAARVSELEVFVFAASDEYCRGLIAWRTAVCGSACTPAPIPESAEPIRVMRDEAGVWESETLEVDGDRDVIIVARDSEGEPFLYGCATVGEDETHVRLFRPWCDTAVCAGQFHPACPVEIDCAAPGAEDPDGLGPPRCVPLAAVVWSFEEAGMECAPPDEAFFGPCRPARISCEPGRAAPVADGVCPAEGAVTCGASLADDLDCDGSFPGPCGPCVAGSTAACGLPGVCAGIARCIATGTFGLCQLPEGSTEACDGTDEDCDGIPDEADPDALLSCNMGRTAGAPRANACVGGACECGGAAVCGPAMACCGDACVNFRTDESNCGRCGNVCAPGLSCSGGHCLPVGCTPEICGGGDEDCDGIADSLDPDAVTQCNEAVPTAPVADGCNSGGCVCGSSPPCASPSVCCAGGCVDVSTDRSHCGSCSNPCGGGEMCIGGTCRRCRAETCGRGDEDCDGVPDTLDPDALFNCNELSPPDAPAADSCAGAVCLCGGVMVGEPPCLPGTACCGGTCVDISTDTTHCGGCDNPCPGVCAAGVCS